MNHSLSSLISTQHTLELDAHVSIDDAISKAYEEVYELSIAIEENNLEEIQKESRDVLINILSVSSRYIDIESLPLSSVSSNNINRLIALWGRETASIRKHYSREKISLEKYRETVTQIISLLVSLTGVDIFTAVTNSIEKLD